MSTARFAVALAFVAHAATAGTPKPLTLALPAPGKGSAFFPALNRVVLTTLSRATGQEIRVATVSATTAWDLAQLDPPALAAACAAGTVRRIDWSRLGGRARWLPIAASDCGAGAFISAEVLSWDDGKRQGPTPDWATFWDVARMPGQRGMQRSPVGTLEIALMADGVAPRDVYAVLRKKIGQDRAFQKLDQLRPYIAWWRSEAEPLAMLAAGQVRMCVAPADRVLAASGRRGRRFGVQWAGAVVAVRSWAIAIASRSPDAAAALIAAATEPKAAAALTGPGRGTALAGQAADPATSPSAHLDTEMALDGGFWRDNGPALTARFDAWLAH